jgi:hypothetical protein
MYKKSIIDANNISFDDRIRYCEDNAFNFDYIRAAKSFSCVDAISYIYRRGHTTALSKNLVYPRMRVHFVEHAQRFCDSIDDSILIEALKVNRSLCRIMWNVVSTGVIIDILDKNYSAARARMRQPLSKSIVELYPPYTKKDKALLFFWKHSFPCLVVLVKLYYSNFERVKKFKRFSFRTNSVSMNHSPSGWRKSAGGPFFAPSRNVPFMQQIDNRTFPAYNLRKSKEE